MPSKKTNVKEETTVDNQDQKAVLAYRVGKLEEATVEGFRKIEEKLNDLEHHYVTKQQLTDATKTADMKHAEQDSRLTKLESWNEWAVKIVFALIIGAVVGLVLVKAPTIGG